MADRKVITTATVEIGGLFYGPGYPLTLPDAEYLRLKAAGPVMDAPKKAKVAPASPPPAETGQGDGT